jgi:hypothetical protein
MNRHRRDRRPVDLPPVNRVPRNLTGQSYLEIVGVGCSSYCPGQDGKGPMTEVHLRIEMKDCVPFVLRIGNKESCDKIIAMLERHRNDVWPGD